MEVTVAGRNSNSWRRSSVRRKRDMVEPNRNHTVFSNSVPPNGLAESYSWDQLWRQLSHVSFPVFLSQGKSCSKTSVWMCYRDGNHGAVKSLLSWLLGLCPAPATSSITAQWQWLLALLSPRTSQSEMMWNARPLPKCCPLSGFIWSQQNST